MLDRHTTFDDLLDRCQLLATTASKLHKKLRDIELYRALALCLEICERCQFSNQEAKQLELRLALQPAIGNRRYFLAGSDIYIRVCRWAFHGDAHLQNIYRYSTCLREAASRQINSSNLAEFLKVNGGMNEFWQKRPKVKTGKSHAKVLILENSIAIPWGQQFNLTLLRLPNNTFKVLAMREGLI